MKLKIYNTTKKLFLLVFIYQFFSCETQSNGFLKIDDDCSLKVRGLVEKYSKNNTSEMVNFISDSVIIYFNNDSFIGLNMLISEFMDDHKMFSKIQMEKFESRNYLKFEDEFIFSINGEVVERPKSNDLRGNNIGIIAGGRGEYVLENIIVKEFMTDEELEKKAPKNISSIWGLIYLDFYL